MMGGNKTALLQSKTFSKNDIGEGVVKWSTIDTLIGFLDYLGGNADVSNYNAKIQESTHLFIMDYKSIEYSESEVRLVIDNKPYDVTMIDNPMELNKHLEIFLKYTGD